MMANLRERMMAQETFVQRLMHQIASAVKADASGSVRLLLHPTSLTDVSSRTQGILSQLQQLQSLGLQGSLCLTWTSRSQD